MDIELAKRIAIVGLKKAGKVLIANFDKEKNVFYKGKNDIFTEVDIKSEKIIIDLIVNNFPDHSILSEEAGLIENNSEYLWVLDPIDGTINYYHNVEPFCIGLCLMKNEEPIINAIYHPIRDHLYFAEKGKGATLNGNKIRVSNRDLKGSVIMTQLSNNARSRLAPNLDDLFSGMHMRVFGSSHAAMSYISGGNFDVFFNINTKIWDILPGALLIQEAGGKVTDIKGDKINRKSTSVLATNGKVHSEMLIRLKNI